MDGGWRERLEFGRLDWQGEVLRMRLGSPPRVDYLQGSVEANGPLPVTLDIELGRSGLPAVRRRKGSRRKILASQVKLSSLVGVAMKAEDILLGKGAIWPGVNGVDGIRLQILVIGRKGPTRTGEMVTSPDAPPAVVLVRVLAVTVDSGEVEKSVLLDSPPPSIVHGDGVHGITH